MPVSSTVTTDLVADLVVAGGPPLPVTSQFSFSRHDPYAITLRFLVDGDHWVTWIFARDLLEQGITASIGEGDVQIWPGEQDGARCVFLHTRSPHGAATFVLSLTIVVEFLLSTLAVVPSGTESDFLDLDAEIEGLRAG
ncbi:MAG TPA: SsgA family sporulation/cell division regulator [Frankiaceae bacterium]|nr:SsgA family sporulation/cell division regulator [Frankiaceae bacterium]